jgi:serine/threonine-protein kinase
MTAPVVEGEVLAGKYQVERTLGAGGMGIVVAARHLQLEERVAIKLLQPDALKDPGLIARFLREARAAAKIRSEHIARVYDVGTLESGAPYLVMEYLDGCDLDALVRRNGPLPPELAAEYALQTCEALAEAHALGIVHRDLKPANLFVTTRSDGSHVIKVIDFGISKIISGPDGRADITKTAEVRGSPLFMSPEQMRRPRDVDARSDIWSLGVTLYNLLSGAFPFYADSVLELCGMIFHDAPQPLRAKRPEIPPGLEAVVIRCLQKDPGHRFANIAELAAAIAGFAPPHARMVAERCWRTLNAAGLIRREPMPSVPSLNAMSQAGAGGTAPLPETRDARPSTAAPPPAPQAQTSRNWGRTNPSLGRPPRFVALAVGAAGLGTVAVVIGLVLVLRASTSPEPPLTTTTTTAVEGAEVSPTAALPSPSEIPPSPVAEAPTGPPAEATPLLERKVEAATSAGSSGPAATTPKRTNAPQPVPIATTNTAVKAPATPAASGEKPKKTGLFGTRR